MFFVLFRGKASVDGPDPELFGLVGCGIIVLDPDPDKLRSFFYINGTVQFKNSFTGT